MTVAVGVTVSVEVIDCVGVILGLNVGVTVCPGVSESVGVGVSVTNPSDSLGVGEGVIGV